MTLGLNISSDCASSVQPLLNGPNLRLSNWDSWSSSFKELASSQPHPASFFFGERVLFLEVLSSKADSSSGAVKIALDEVFLDSLHGCSTNWLDCYNFLEERKAHWDKMDEELRKSLGGNMGKAMIQRVNLNQSKIAHATTVATKSMVQYDGRLMIEPLTHQRKLSSIQLHLLLRSFAEENRTCPTIETFSISSFGVLLQDPVSDSLLTLSAISNGFELRPEYALRPEYSRGQDESDKPLWTFTCDSSLWEEEPAAIALATTKALPDEAETTINTGRHGDVRHHDELKTLQLQVRMGIHRIGPNEVEVDWESLKSTMEKPSILGNTRIVGTMKNGKPDGFKIYGFTSDSVASTLGLRVGDTIHRLNGNAVVSPGDISRILGTLESSSKSVLRLEISRWGILKTLVFHLH